MCEQKHVYACSIANMSVCVHGRQPPRLHEPGHAKRNNLLDMPSLCTPPKTSTERGHITDSTSSLLTELS